VRIRLLLWSIFLSSGLALAHVDGEEEGEGEAGEKLIDCEHPPGNLKTSVPKIISGVAAIACTPSAQHIHASKGWTWRFPANFFQVPTIPAFSPFDSRNEPAGRFFTGFEIVELDATQTQEKHKWFAQHVVTYPGSQVPAKIVKLVATNDLGHSLDAFFGFKTDKEGWVVLCAPECAPEFVFLMQKRN
jgi:hypothetical protein